MGLASLLDVMRCDDNGFISSVSDFDQMIPNGLPNDRINANRRLVQNQEFRFYAVSVEMPRKIYIFSTISCI